MGRRLQAAVWPNSGGRWGPADARNGCSELLQSTGRMADKQRICSATVLSQITDMPTYHVKSSEA